MGILRLEPAAVSPAIPVEVGVRPRVQGKFIFVGDEKLYVRGVTYGTFRPREDGSEYQDRLTVERDFAQMTAHGVNAVRTYTVPPQWFLDTAQENGLRVMVGLPWEQHVAFLDGHHPRSIEERVRDVVRSCANHPAILCYTIGNEIPASIVRWYGRHRIEQHLERLYRAVKAEDPEGLVTYVNYPSTEYLQLPFADFTSFNVYIESQDRLQAYLARLQNIAGDQPLVMAEIGLDSRRNGEYSQAQVLDWQIRTAFAAGCAGAFVFAWTDEWYRGGYDIADWDFGLTDRHRRPKPALTAVQQAFTDVPFPADLPWPSVSVVICTHNGARTIRDCLEGVMKLDYPDFNVIVVDDGSTDATAGIAAEYPCHLISIENHGLSYARNIGLAVAKGEIVAYLDDDAWPDPHWLTYLAATFMSTAHAGVGGPNIPPPNDGAIAECVANAPGGPVHVLLSDAEAEHIPGCNMAFRKAYLLAIQGFDPQFRAAGDDVDICWRLQQQGWTLGFSPAAMVWHHRRNSVRAYWKQQIGYGKAEALLERKWPDKYNTLGHLSWSGRLYGNGLTRMLGCRARIYHGTWGSALFQSVYQPAPGVLRSLPLMPEWHLLIIILAAFSALSFVWKPLLFALPLLTLAVGVPVVQAGLSAMSASFTSASRTPGVKLRLWILTAILHLFQPSARLWGRMRHGLTLWRRRTNLPRTLLPCPRTSTIWSEQWQAPDAWLHGIEGAMKADGAVVLRGSGYDRWDLEVRSGILGAARTRMAIEEHGGGKQLVRFYSWPRPALSGVMLTLLVSGLSIGAAFDKAWMASAILGAIALLLALRTFQECAAAVAALRNAQTAGEGRKPMFSMP